MHYLVNFQPELLRRKDWNRSASASMLFWRMDMLAVAVIFQTSTWSPSVRYWQSGLYIWVPFYSSQPQTDCSSSTSEEVCTLLPHYWRDLKTNLLLIYILYDIYFVFICIFCICPLCLHVMHIVIHILYKYHTYYTSSSWYYILKWIRFYACFCRFNFLLVHLDFCIIVKILHIVINW